MTFLWATITLVDKQSKAALCLSFSDHRLVICEAGKILCTEKTGSRINGATVAVSGCKPIQRSNGQRLSQSDTERQKRVIKKKK